MIKPKDNFDEKLFNYFKNNTKIPIISILSPN